MAKAKAKHCWNCGNEVEGKQAEHAATVGVAFCCYCGIRLRPSGKCKNEDCKFYDAIPSC